MVGALPGQRELPGGDHPGQLVGGLEVGQLQPARRAHAARLVCRVITAIARPAAAYGDGLLPHRTSSRHSGSPSRTSRPGRRPRRACDEPGGDERAHARRRRARSARSWAHLPAGPEPARLPVGQPQHEVGEREVGEDLPVRHEQLQPGDVVLHQVGVGSHEFVEGRHRTRLGRSQGRLAGWGACRSAYWDQVQAAGFKVPSDRPLDDLTAELTTMLGSTRPEVRDGTAFPALATWIDRGIYDDLLIGLGDGMVAGLAVGLGESGTDTVFRRSLAP